MSLDRCFRQIFRKIVFELERIRYLQDSRKQSFESRSRYESQVFISFSDPRKNKIGVYFSFRRM